MNKEPNYI